LLISAHTPKEHTKVGYRSRHVRFPLSTFLIASLPTSFKSMLW